MALAERDIPEGIRNDVTLERLQLCLGRIVVVREKLPTGYRMHVGLLTLLEVNEEENTWWASLDTGSGGVWRLNAPGDDSVVEYIYVADSIPSMIDEFRGEISGANSN